MQSAEIAPELTFEPLLEEKFGWRRLPARARVLWFRGAIHGRDAETLAAEAGGLALARLPEWLDGLDGHFSLILTGPDFSFAAVDPVRGYPLLWARDGDRLLVSHDGPALVHRLGLGPDDIDPAQADAFLLAGFTIGAATLYRGIHQLVPGTYVTVCPGVPEPDIAAYHEWRPTRPAEAGAGDLRAPLSRLNERLISDLVAGAKGRRILVPLSAGIDSRFVVSGLAAAGYDNVQCLSYGLPGNREAVIGRRIARRLGYDWTFIPYSNRFVRAAWATEDHRVHEAYADSLTAIPFPQDYPALTALRGQGRLNPETIVVNGQSGDFTSGNHIPAALIGHDGGSPARRLARILDALVAKHFKHWHGLVVPERVLRVKTLLRSEIDRAGGLPDDPTRDHGVYELSEFVDRQAKYVVNGQRVYEYLGLEWRLPLWQRASLDFWERAPLEAKAHQRLYREVLREDDWGGVWRDIPINPTRIRPLWLKPLRLMAKAAYAPLGAERWHRFERRYVNYWMSPLCAFAEWPYGEVRRERLGAHGAIAFHIRKYLNGKTGAPSPWFA